MYDNAPLLFFIYVIYCEKLLRRIVMRLGRLTDFLNIAQRVTQCEGQKQLPLEKAGYLFDNRTLKIKWDNVWDMGADIHFDLSEKAFVSVLKLELAGSGIRSVTLIDGSDSTVLHCHRAESSAFCNSTCLELEAGVITDKLIVRIVTDFSGIEVKCASIFGAVDFDDSIFPIPQRLTYANGTVSFERLASHTCNEPSQKAAAVFCEKLFEESGVVSFPSSEGFVEFILDSSLSYNAYTVSVRPNGVVLKASDERGFVMAAEALVKLFSDEGVRCAELSDSPANPFRGVHIYLPGESEMEFAKRFIKYYISPLGYNMLIVELAGAFEYKSHPEINQMTADAYAKGKRKELPPFPHGSVGNGKTVSQKSVADFVDYVRSFAIEPVPEVQSLGHVQFMTYAHPEIAEVEENTVSSEIDTRVEDMRPEKFYRHCYCPSNPKSYELLFDLLDEIIAVFRPVEYVHMGHDEVYEIGVCKICKDKDPAVLFAQDVQRIYDYLKARGLKMMMWADMLQPVTKYRTPRAIDMIPKDILLLDFIWYFHTDKDIETNLLDKGFKVAFGNLYSSHFPRYCKRINQKGIVGGQISGWVGTNPVGLAKEGKFFDMALTAQMLLSRGYSPDLTLVYDKIISAKMPRFREKLENFSFPSLEKGAVSTELLHEEVELPPKYLPMPCINVDKKVKSICIEHMCTRYLVRKPWSDPQLIAEYRFEYSDGTVDVHPVYNSLNIGYYNRRQHSICKNPLYRHNGYTTDFFCGSKHWKSPFGEDMSLYTVEFLTDSEKTLSRITLLESSDAEPRIKVFSVSVIQ